MSDTPIAATGESLEDFIKSLEEASQDTVPEQDIPAVDAEQEHEQAAPTQSVGGAPVSPELMALHNRQIEVSERLARMMEEKQAAQNPPQDDKLLPDFNIQVEDLTPEEREAYAASEKVIGKMAMGTVAKVMADYTEKVVRPMAEQNRRMETMLAQMQTNTAAQADSMADAQLRTLTQNSIGDYNSFINSATWQNYLNSEVPGSSGISYKALASIHASNGNLPAIAQMMIAANGGAVTAQRQTTPGSAASPAPVRGSNSKALPYSRFKEAMNSYQRGQLTQEAFNKVSNAYDLAAQAGKVDYDK